MSMNSDAKLKEFWKENAHFADLYNTVLFEGKNVILPEMLQEAGTDLSMDLENLKKSRKKIASIEKYRDIFNYGKDGHLLSLVLKTRRRRNTFFRSGFCCMIYWVMRLRGGGLPENTDKKEI